jgi:hypothetical protein
VRGSSSNGAGAVVSRETFHASSSTPCFSAAAALEE